MKQIEAAKREIIFYTRNGKSISMNSKKTATHRET